MKKLLTAALLLISSMAFAEDVVLAERNVPIMTSTFHTWSDAHFYMDTESGEGFIKVSVVEDRWMMGGYYDTTGRWYPNRIPMPVTLFSETIKVPGLMLVNKKMIYQGTAGEVECGYMGLSRVFKRPTLYLNGKCKLDSRLSGNWNDTKLTVTLSLK